MRSRSSARPLPESRITGFIADNGNSGVYGYNGGLEAYNATAGLVAQAAAQLDPVDAGQHEIEQHQLRLHPFEHLETFLARPRPLDLVTLGLEIHPHQIGDGILVLDEQHPPLVHP